MNHKINFRFLLILICSLQITNSFSQTTITLQAAIDSALKNNLDIQISRNNSKIASNNSSLGNTGMLPRVDVDGGYNYAVNTLRQETSSGIVTNKDGVNAETYSGKAELGWTIFDGAKMFATRKKLQTLQQIGELDVKRQITVTIASVAATYFELVREQQLVQKNLATFNLYDERKRLADRKLTLGNAAKTELLQANVDFNTQQSNLYTLKNNLRSAQIRLNELLVHPFDETLIAVDSLSPDTTLQFGDYLNKLENGNLDLQEQLLLSEVSNQELKEIKAGFFPQLDVNAAYNYNNNIATQGFYLKNQVYGPSAGIGLTWNIFNGSNQQRLTKNAKLSQQNAQLNVSLIKQSVNSALATSWTNYQSALVIYHNELESEKFALENLDIMTKRFRLNESNVLELRTAQQTVEEVQIRLANALYTCNISKVELQQLTGTLIK